MNNEQMTLTSEHWWRLGIWTWGALALLLFTPASWLDRFQLETVLAPVQPLLAIAFVVLSAVFLSETFADLGKGLLSSVHKRLLSGRIRERLAVLDHQERAILREFFLQRRSTIGLPSDEPAVQGLVEVGVLRSCRLPDGVSPPGYQGYQIHPWARPLLTSRTLNLPVGEMNDDQIQYLKATRPEFVLKELRLRRRRAAAAA